MPISLLAIFVSLYTIYILWAKHSLKEKYMELLTLNSISTLFRINGYFVKISGVEIGTPLILANVAFFCYSCRIFLLYRRCLNRNYIIAAIAYLFVLFLGIVYEIVLPYEGMIVHDPAMWDLYGYGFVYEMRPLVDMETWISFVRIIKYVFLAYILKLMIDAKMGIAVIRRIAFWGMAFVAWGGAEYVCKNVLGLYDVATGILTVFLGDMERHIYFRGDAYALLGWCTEPAEYVSCLFVLFSVVAIGKKVRDASNEEARKGLSFCGYPYLVCILLIMFLTRGFSSIWYGAFSVLVLIYLDFSFQRISVKFLFRLALLMAGGIMLLNGVLGAFEADAFDMYVRRMESAIATLEMLLNGTLALGINVADSSVPRMLGIYQTFLDFAERFLLGLGLNTEVCHSTLVTTLANIGILGLMSWLLLIRTKVRQQVNYDVKLILLVVLLAGFLNGYPFSVLYYLHNVVLLELSSLYMERKEEGVAEA